MSQVSYGTITITDTNDIESITVEYNRNQSSSSAPSATDSGWSTTRPNWAQGYYIWQRTRVHKSGTTADKDVIGTAVCITGSTGSTGAPGRGLTDTTTQYCNYGTGEPADDYSGWVDAPPTYDSSKPNYWVMITNTYSAAPTSEIIKYKDEALTKAVADAAIANSIATHANEDAQGAMSQATATQVAQEALASKLQRIWRNQNTYIYGNTYDGITWNKPNYPAGTYAASGIDGITFDEQNSSTYGFNSFLRHTFLSFRYNTHQLVTIGTGVATDDGGISGLAINTPIVDSTNKQVINVARGMELTSGSLTFYKPPTIDGTTVTPGEKAMELTGNALNFYGSSDSTPDASLSSTGLNLTKGSITLGNYFSVTNTGDLTAKSGIIGGWSFTDAALYYSNATPGYSTTNLVVSKNSAVNTNAIAGSDTNKHWFLVAGRKFGVDTEGNLYANNAHLSSATVEGAITATSLTISGGGATYDGASAINANGYTIEIIEDETAAPTGSVLTETQTYLYPVMYLNGVVVTTGITKTNYIWYTNENTATTGGVAGDSTNGGIIATYGNTYRVTYNLSDDAVGTTPSQQTIYTSDARHITDISSSGITIHPEDGTAGNYMQLDSDGLKIYKSSTLLANYGTTVTIGSSSAKNVYIDSNGVQIRDSATSLAEFGTTARIGQSTSSRFLMNSDSLQAYGHDNSLYFEVNSNGLTWGSGNTAATTTQVNSAAQTATNFLSFDETNGLQLASSSPSTATRKVQILSDAIRIKNNNTNYLNIDSTGMQLHKGGRKIADFGTNIILGPEDGPHTEITSSNVDFYVRSGFSSRKAMSIENDGCFKVYQSDNSPIMIAGNFDSESGILLGSTDLNTTGGRLFGGGTSYGDDTYTTHKATLSLSAYAESPTGRGYASGTLSLTASANNGRNSNHIIIRGTTDGTGGIESSTTIVVNSDERLKENCIYINHISDLLLKIQPIVYSWKDKRITQRCFGFKAQDVKTALNEVVENVDDYALVSKNDNGYYNLSYTELIPLIVDIIQKQEKRIVELETKLEGGNK